MAGALLLLHNFSVNYDTAAVGASGVETGGSGFTIVQITAVLQDADIGIDTMPQFVAQGRTEILHDEFVTGLEISAATTAFGDGELYLHKIPCKNARMVCIRAFGVEIRRCPEPA